MILVDTNILLRLRELSHPQNLVAWAALKELRNERDEHFVVAAQSLYEMFVVLTRPQSVNGYGYDADQALQQVIETRDVFQVYFEDERVYAEWESLVNKYNIRGKRGHDLRLAALMIRHDMRALLTFNDADFRQLDEIDVLNPFDVVGQPRI